MEVDTTKSPAGSLAKSDDGHDRPDADSIEGRRESGQPRREARDREFRNGRSQPEEGTLRPVTKPGRVAASQPRRGLLARLTRIFRLVFFSSLTRRIVSLNLVALAVLLSGILYLNQFREGLIDARVESLLIQGRIIAGAIASSATVDTNTIMVDPEKLIELHAGESISPKVDSFDTLDSPIKQERVAPILRTLIQPTSTRARIYDRDGILLLDSRHLYAGSQILRYDLQPLNTPKSEGMISRIGALLNKLLQRRDLPLYQELAGTGTGYPEVMKAMTGAPSTIVRMSNQGELIVSVAVPVQRFRAVLGVLLLSTQGGDIDRIVTEERIAIMRVFLVAGAVLTLLSILLASTIATPLRKLADAAVRVRHGVKTRVQIPDFSRRQDEIGNLSQTLRDMTNALYARIEAIESFAADVSHELKNPLTSLRSAVETLPLARNDVSRNRLMEIIQHDVRRLDRLITDISDASRLDAELAREDSKPVNLAQLLENVVAMRKIVAPGKKPVEINLSIEKSRNVHAYDILGHDGRLGQVINNLLDNARSFVPENGGRIDVAMRRIEDRIEVTVTDNGPGIQAEKIDRIFERFYTDRPDTEDFGQNSGLGLSISKQIIEAHGGSITADNREPPETGARFTLVLPRNETGGAR
ncbi:MAG: sensor histidine kinase [Nitratireductor sp.]|nr:sensor histidine kinase [Nitratireductor sp.]MCB1456419.1 sensor histidine kinase [Nitratireductor sp.]